MRKITFWLLMLITVVVLVVNALCLPDPALLTEYAALLVIYGLLTAFTLFFGVVLTEGTFSPAHIIGMLALLSLPPEVTPAMTWAIALGGVVGGLLFIIHKNIIPTQRQTVYYAVRAALMTARVTISFYAAGQFYSLLGGRLPLTNITWDDAAPLTGFMTLYIVLYFVIFVLHGLVVGRAVPRFIRANVAELLVILVLPLPSVLFGVEVFNRLSTASFAFLIIGIALTILGQYGISRAQRQLRKQLDELRSLSVLTQVVSANLDLNALLKMIYTQVSQLLSVEHFLVGLYTRHEHTLEYPLVIVRGKVVDLPPDETVIALDPAGKQLIDHLLHVQKPVLINREIGETIGLALPAGVNSWLGVPLLTGGRMLGVMVTTSERQHHFGTDALRLFNLIATSVSIAIDNAQLYAQQTARVNQLVTLNNVLALLTDTLSPDTVLDTVITSASAISDAHAVSVYLFWDETQTTLALVRSAGLSHKFSVDAPDPLVLNSLKRQEVNPQPIIIEDVAKDERAASLRALLAHENVTALIELPLVVGATSLGVVAIYFNEPRVFSDEDVELLRTFANQAAQAIHNARLYASTDETLERRMWQLVALSGISNELPMTTDLDTISHLILNHTMSTTGAKAGAVVLREKGDGDPYIAAERGYPPGTFNNRAVVEQGMTGAAFFNAKPRILPDVTTEPDYFPLLPMTRSQLTVPIARGDEIFGAITLESEQVNGFNEDDVRFVGQLANQALIAIERTYEFQRTRETRNRLELILNTISEAIILIDNEGKVRLANPCVSLIGLKPEQLLNHSIEDLLDQPHLYLVERMGFRSEQDLHKLLREMRTRGTVARDPVVYLAQGESGMVSIQRHIIPVSDKETQIVGVLLVFYDQTEQHNLNQLREDLSHMIIHDMRSPLTAVTTGLKLLNDLVPKDSEFKPMVEMTTDVSRRAIRKLLARVDSLLDVARMESGQLHLDKKPTELATLVDSVCVELSPLAHELNVKLLSEVADNLPPLEIDADKIERVLLNLVDNALKFSPMDSMVTVRTHAPGVDGADPSFVRIDVIDHGPGVPDAYKELLFDRFAQIEGRKGAREGSGLGLTFCRLVTESHGGRIWVEDNADGGSIFAFTLPIAGQEVNM